MPKVVQGRSAPSIQQTITLPQQEPADSPEILLPEDKASAFWEKINSISVEQWETTYLVYLYRGLKGGYIEKIAHAFDIEWVKAKYGGGTFRALLQGPNGKMVDSLSFVIDGNPKPEIFPPPSPNPNPQPQVSDSASIVKEVVGILREELRASRDASNPNPGVNHQTAALNGIVEMLKKQVPEPKDPVELFGKMKDLFAPSTASGNGMMEKIMMMMFEKIIAGPAPTTDTKLSAVTEKLIEKALDSLENGGRGRTPSFTTILAEKSPELLQYGAQMLDKWKAITQEQTIQAQYRYAAAAAIASRQPLPPGNPAIPGVTIPAHPAQPGQPPRVPGIGLDVEPLGAAVIDGQGSFVPLAPQQQQQALALDQFLKERVVDMFRRGKAGSAILDFIDGADERLVQMFEDANQAQLEMFFKSDPVLAQAAHFPRFQQILSEIVEALTEEDESVAEEMVN